MIPFLSLKLFTPSCSVSLYRLRLDDEALNEIATGSGWVGFLACGGARAAG